MKLEYSAGGTDGNFQDYFPEFQMPTLHTHGLAEHALDAWEDSLSHQSQVIPITVPVGVVGLIKRGGAALVDERANSALTKFLVDGFHA